MSSPEEKIPSSTAAKKATLSIVTLLMMRECGARVSHELLFAAVKPGLLQKYDKSLYFRESDQKIDNLPAVPERPENLSLSVIDFPFVRANMILFGNDVESLSEVSNAVVEIEERWERRLSRVEELLQANLHNVRDFSIEAQKRWLYRYGLAPNIFGFVNAEMMTLFLNNSYTDRINNNTYNLIFFQPSIIQPTNTYYEGDILHTFIAMQYQIKVWYETDYEILTIPVAANIDGSLQRDKGGNIYTHYAVTFELPQHFDAPLHQQLLVHLKSLLSEKAKCKFLDQQVTLEEFEMVSHTTRLRL